MSDCLFCKMLTGEIPCQKIFENDQVLGFKDIHPQASIHNLFIHKEHCRDVTTMTGGQIEAVFAAIKEWSENSGQLAGGFRIVTNVGKGRGPDGFSRPLSPVGRRGTRPVRTAVLKLFSQEAEKTDFGHMLAAVKERKFTVMSSDLAKPKKIRILITYAQPRAAETQDYSRFRSLKNAAAIAIQGKKFRAKAHFVLTGALTQTNAVAKISKTSPTQTVINKGTQVRAMDGIIPVEFKVAISTPEIETYPAVTRFETNAQAVSQSRAIFKQLKTHTGDNIAVIPQAFDWNNPHRDFTADFIEVYNVGLDCLWPVSKQSLRRYKGRRYFPSRRSRLEREWKTRGPRRIKKRSNGLF